MGTRLTAYDGSTYFLENEFVIDLDPRMPCWDLFDHHYEIWKECRRDKSLREGSRRIPPVIEQPVEPYILTLPLELLPQIFQYVDKAMWIKLSTVNSNFRTGIIHSLRTLTTLKLSEFLPPAFAIETEDAVVFLLSNAVNVECLTVSGSVLRVLQDRVVALICSLRKLKTLDISGCFISDFLFMKLVHHHLQLEELRVRYLTISYEEIDFEGRSESLAVRNVVIEVIHENNPFSDFFALQEISDHTVDQLAQMKKLRKLEISYSCPLKDTSLRHLLRSLPQLEELIMDGQRGPRKWSPLIASEALASQKNLKVLSICGSGNMTGECMLNMELKEIRMLSLLNWNVLSSSTIKRIIKKCSSLEELRFKLEPSPPNPGDLSVCCTKLITDSIRNPQLLKSLSLFNVHVDGGFKHFIARCTELRHLSIEPYRSDAEQFGHRVVLRRRRCTNSLEVTSRLFYVLDLRGSADGWRRWFELRELEVFEFPYGGAPMFFDRGTLWAPTEYVTLVKDTMSSLSNLKKLRTLNIVWKGIHEFLSEFIPNQVLHQLDVLDIWFGRGTPVDIILIQIDRICRGFAGIA